MVVVGVKPTAYALSDGDLFGNTPFPAALLKDITSLGYYPGWVFQRFPLTRAICAPGQFNAAEC